MKKLFIGVILFFNILYTNAQDNHINCIIFIDGKLHRLSEIDVSLEFADSLVIDLPYVIGELKIDERAKLFIDSLDATDELLMKIEFRDNGHTRIYTNSLKVGWLRYRYLIARITNLNKKKGKYYFAFSTPGPTQFFINKEYNMFE